MDNKESALLFGKIGGVSSLVHYLARKYADTNVQSSAISCLLILSSFRGQLQTIIQEANTFPLLIALLDSSVDKLVIYICDTIQNLCIDNEQNRKYFCGCDAPAKLTRAISSASDHNPLRLILLHTLKIICSHIGTFKCKVLPYCD